MNRTKIVACAALIFAVVLLVFAFVAFDCEVSVYYPDEAYGGDAYTGIQNATAATARRVATLNNTVALVGGGLLLAASFGMFCFAFYLFQKEEPVLPHELPRVDERPRCVQCGSILLSKNAKYCGVCGTQVKDAPKPVADGWACTCGKVNPPYQTTCACGVKKPHETPVASHKWLCSSCGQMRSQTPCEHCGKE